MRILCASYALFWILPVMLFAKIIRLAVSLSRILRSRELTQLLLKLKTKTPQNFKSLLWNGQNEAFDNCSTSSVSTYITFTNMCVVQNY